VNSGPQVLYHLSHSPSSIFCFPGAGIKPRAPSMLGKHTTELHPQPISVESILEGLKKVNKKAAESYIASQS
jgi:hypothetical protein